MTLYTPLAPIVPGLGAMAARTIRRQMSEAEIAYFTAYYFRDDDGRPLKLAGFHVEMLDESAGNEEWVIFLEPAAHGKTTMVARIFPIYCLCIDPNERIVLHCKTSTDAKARLLVIKGEMESNAPLVEDWGPFVGDKWKEDEINVANRTIRSKEPSIKVAGAETSLVGWRATIYIADDVVTNQNSGPQVRPETRARLRENWYQHVRKMKVPNTKFRGRWVNTVVDMRDLIHEVTDLAHHPNPADWTWKIHRGGTTYKVIRRQALDELTGAVLWPEGGHSLESLNAERAEDPISFLKRMQNKVIEPSLMTFQPEWITGDVSQGLPGCLDHTRTLGQIPGALDAPVQVAGYDPNPGLSEQSKWCGHIRLAFDKRAPQDNLALYITGIARFRETIEKQAEFVVREHQINSLAETKIEANAANQWLLQLNIIRQAKLNGMRIEPHYTTSSNKPDPDIGIPALAGIVRAGLLRIPYGDAHSRAMADLLIAEMVQHPMALTSDLLMALWFSWLAVERARKTFALGVVGSYLPEWAQRRGLSLGALETFFGRRM